jgi:hypothetical protein
VTSRHGQVLACVVLALLSAAGVARAGTYDVYACGGPAGAAQNAFVASANANMDAYSICPPGSSVGTGIVTKATSSGGVAPYFAGAFQVFSAPAGASLHSVTFNVGAIRLHDYWSTGIVSFDGDFNSGDLPYGCYPFRSGCGVGTPTFSVRQTVPLYNRARFRFETRCFNLGGCPTTASGFSPGNRALFSAADVVVRVEDWTQPSVSPHSGALWRLGWHRGYEEAWSAYTDNAGIMVTRMTVDGEQRDVQDYRDGRWPDWARCDFTRPRPCVDVVPGGLALDTATLADGAHQMRVEAVDTAGNVGSLHHEIHVDNHAPAKPAALVVEGGEGWRQTNDFAVRWANPPGQAAPITRARYRLCQGSTCTDGSREGQELSSIRLQAPAPGDYTLRLWLEDAAGNHDPERASDPVSLRFDDEAPVAVFEATDSGDPLTVKASVTDRGAGVATGSIEARRAGEAVWRDLAARLEGGLLAAALDDTSLPSGTYELRARVRDGAGNERTADRRRDGDRMLVTLPVRVAARIVLDRRRRCRKRRGTRPRCATDSGPVRGNGTTVRGVLRAGDRALAGSRIAVRSAPRSGGAPARTASVTTDAGGRFAFGTGEGPSRLVRFDYEGTRTIRPARAEVRVLVRARSSIAVNRRFALNGQAVRFRGRLARGPIPDGGKLIDLQAHYRGRWRTFATPRTDARGRWSYDYRFEATSGLVTYRFRARIRREAAYPYELGHSRAVRVTVRG